MTSLYEKDFYAWSLDQAEHLKKRKFDMIDYDHLIEEIETLTGSQQDSLRSYMKQIMIHLLKKEYQSERDCKSWDDSIDHGRSEAAYILKKNPSFKRFLPEFLPLAYKGARVIAFKEIQNNVKFDIDVFPKECPWTIEDVLGNNN